MIYAAAPWGLLALTSLGAVVFLYFFVFRGRRIEVSSLHLWQAARSLRLEGQQKHRPPITLPFVLELLSALLLSLLVAAVAFTHRAGRRHLVVVLDSSASMSAVADGVSARDRATEAVMGLLDELGRGARITLVASGFEPRIIGLESMEAPEVRAALAGWRPAGPDHSFEPAIELARALSAEEAVPVLVTDHAADAEGVDVVAVGQAADNAGWVSSHWLGGEELFALARSFGGEGPPRTVHVYGNDTLLGRHELDFAARDTVPLSVSVPDNVNTVRLELPEDALANDNVLQTTRPAYMPVTVRVDLGDEAFARYVRRAVQAAPRAVLNDGNRPGILFCQEDRPAGAEVFCVQFRTPQGETVAQAGPYTVNPYHPMTHGVDMRGVIWPADVEFRSGAGLPLLSAGDVPLAVLEDNTLTLNLAAGGNLFTTAAWPVLTANVIDYVHQRAPGLKRLSYRLGETLSFYRPDSWGSPVEIVTPDGDTVSFDDRHVYYGRLEREGIYRVMAGGVQVAAFDVNLLSEAESDLTGAVTAGQGGSVRAGEIRERAGHRFHREFALLVAAMLLGCWYLLERRAP